MPKKFEKGNPGKPKGAKNKVNQDARALFVKIMEGEVENVQDALAQVRKKSPFNYLLCFSKLAPYFMPKQLDIKTDGEKIQAPVIQILPHNEG